MEVFALIPVVLSLVWTTGYVARCIGKKERLQAFGIMVFMLAILAALFRIIYLDYLR